MRKGNSGFKKILYIYGGLLLILIIASVTVYIVYNNKVKESARQSLLAAEKLNNLVLDGNTLAEVSSEISKGINEVIGEGINDVVENGETDVENGQMETDELDTSKEDANEIETNTEIENNNQESPIIENEGIEQPVEEPVKELEFCYPVQGEIAKEFAMENLVFSETLQEWVVHKGVDIKAPRTTVVKAAEEGTVESIKNDPRYGLTVIVSHRDGYKTVYSNLLTTEFVTEGEVVSKGQSLGTVGNSGAFEIADEPHLHFEMLKDEENVDPKLYLK